MKNIIRILFLSMCFFSLNSVLRAQTTCPPSGWNGCSTWTSHTRIYTLPSGCQVQVTYCTGCEGEDNPKLYISGIQPLNPACDGVNFHDMLTQVSDALYNDPGVAVEMGIPPCNPKTGHWVGAVVHMYLGQCWELTIFNFGWFTFPIYLPCELVVCEEICEMCISPDGQSLSLRNCHWTSQGTLNCTPMPSGSWELNTCYTVLPCIQ
jgi:hypothetical protein